MKALNQWGLGPGKGKSGFTLIEVLIVIIVLAILAGVVVIAVGGSFGTAQSDAYSVSKDDIRNAILAYNAENNGRAPFNESVHMPINTECATATACHILNMSALLTTNGGMLHKVPEGVAALSGSEDDNCDQGSGAVCSNSGHYIWGVGSSGDVISYCTDEASEAKGTCLSSASGFQGIWP